MTVINFRVWNYWLKVKISELFKFEKEFHVFQFSQFLWKIVHTRVWALNYAKKLSSLKQGLGFSKTFRIFSSQPSCTFMSLYLVDSSQFMEFWTSLGAPLRWSKVVIFYIYCLGSTLTSWRLFSRPIYCLGSTLTSYEVLISILLVDDIVLLSSMPNGFYRQLDSLFIFCDLFQSNVN